MFCTECGSAIPEGQIACPRCSAAARTAGGATAPAAATAAPAPAPAAAAPRSTPLQIVLVCLYGILLLVPMALFSISRSEGSLAFALGRSLIPAVIVILYYRKKQVSGTRIAFSLITWIFVGNLFLLGQGLQSRKPTLRESDIPGVLRDAAGIGPVPAQDTPERAALRESYRALLARSRKYEEDIARIDGTPEMKNLLRPPSYASLGTMQATLGYLKEEREVERVQGNAVDDFVADFSREVQGFDWPRTDKEAFMKGLEKSLAEQAPVRNAAVQAKIAWLDADIQLYEFAAAHHDGIRGGEKVIIPDAGVRTEFNQRVDQSEAARKRFLAAVHAWQQMQQGAQQKMGISQKELGLGKQ